MTFGKIKTTIEKNLLESYKNQSDFKKTLKEFKHNILNDKNISKAYSIYDQLSTPQSLEEKDAKEFLEEGINLLQRILPTIKLPKSAKENLENNYKDIDNLVYTNKIDISERVISKKNIITVLMNSKNQIKESINIPIKSMVNVANQTLKSYVDSLNENDKKEFFQIISEDSKVLESKFEEMRKSAITKLNSIMETEEESETKNRISETIEKIKIEKFDQITFIKLKNLVSSI